jgi:DnaJ family protein A protein 2
MDHYSILGLNPNVYVTSEVLNKAYKKMALKYHPDRGGTSKMFQDLKVSHEVLSDPVKKRAYDAKIRKIIKPAKGKTVNREILLTLEQLYHGASLKFKIDRNRIYGSDSFSFCRQNKVTICNVCTGTGYVEQQRRVRNYVQRTRIKCRDCHAGLKLAPGAVIKKVSTNIQLNIKAGTMKDSRITVCSESDERIGELPGDIVFHIKEKPHPLFQRKGSTLYYTMSISLKQALTSPTLKMHHLSGKEISIPLPKNKVMTDKTLIWIDRCGMPLVDSQKNVYGRLGVRFTVEFPETLTQRQQEQLEAILS